MFRTLTLGAIAALAISGHANAADPPTVRSVDVDVRLDAIQNPKAALYWSNLSADLQNAIAARLVGRVDDDGLDLKIDIEEVSLSDGFDEQLGLADTQLIGDVRMEHQSGDSRLRRYRLGVDVNQARSMLPADVNVTTLPADTRIYYEAMVGTFAQAVVDRLR